MEGIRVMLIEDNPGDAGLVETALEDSGGPSIELHVEPRLAPALARLARERFAVVLLDLNLPDSNGFDTVTSVQEVVPRLPVVIMTGSADEAFARRAIKAGVQDYLIKDTLRPTTLLRSILFAMERKRIENDLHALERVATAASSSLDLNSMLETMLATLRAELDGDRAAVVLGTDGEHRVRKAVGSDLDLVPSDYWDVERSAISEVVRTGETHFHEMRAPGGVVRTMLKVPLLIEGKAAGVVEVDWAGPHPQNAQEASLLRIAADRIASGVANVQAFEAVKASERRAEEERLRLRTIMDKLPVGILITDSKGKEVESNSYRDRVWGGHPTPSIDTEDLCNMKAWWADTGDAVGECPIVKALRYGETTIGAVIDIERLDGRRGTILASVAPITDLNGRSVGAVAVQQDITDQIRLERELAEAKGRAEFYLDLLTHDINNSLASASGYLQLIHHAGGADERTGRWLGGAESSLDESIKLIETIRKVQRSHDREVERSTVDLNPLINEVIAQTREREDGRVQITYHAAGRTVVVGNELLRDLFSNLLGNAVKHSSGMVSIEVTVRSQTFQGQEFVRVDVADNGPGIPDDLKERLFRKGERGKAKAPGRGLGLFLAQNIVMGTGGRMWVEDRITKDHTQGTRFVVLLPTARDG